MISKAKGQTPKRNAEILVEIYLICIPRHQINNLPNISPSFRIVLRLITISLFLLTVLLRVFVLVLFVSPILNPIAIKGSVPTYNREFFLSEL
jgi:hypothetical protein